MATATVTEILTTTIHATAATASSSNRATPQGGVFEGVNPTHYDTKNPITLFIIQASIVIALTRIIHWPLTWLRQPRVIAEVITGIVLGPSIMGRIPGFTQHIFPLVSMPAFSLVANLGLVLFLFLVGLEVDLRFLVSNWRIALSVGALGMALPFGLGGGIAYGLYHEFRDDEGVAPISFGVYLLFIGVAMAITAFPVLCRILTSLKLLGTPVGVIVLSAGVGNDVVGWILLALCVALVNSGAGLTALWILLVSVGYCLFVAYPVRWAFYWLLRRTGSLANGPTQGVVAITVMLVLASSFFTQIIGIHAIFGAFIIGLICPHEGGFAIKLTEKIEDLVSVLFLPLYFAMSGLNTNLGLLDSGMVWGYVVGVCAIAFIGKIAGGTLASRLNGLVWRESLTIGCLMSCKGLVELIVLNIGLQAHILSTRTFTIFVVMALVTTFATTPLVVWLYPPWYQTKLELWKQGKIDWDGNRLQPDDDDSSNNESDSLTRVDVARKVLVYLRLDGLPSLFTMVNLFAAKREDLDTLEPKTTHEADAPSQPTLLKHPGALASVVTLRRPLQMHGLRLMELTERESSVMRVSEIEEFAARDPVIKAFGTFGQSRDIAVGGQIAVVPDHSFSGTLLSRARELRSDLILLPWSETGTMSEYPNFFDTKPSDPLANADFSTLALEIYRKAHEHCGVGVYLDRTVLSSKDNLNSSTSTGHQRTHSNPVVDATRGLARTQTGLSIGVGDQTRTTVHFGLSESGRYRIFVLYTGTQDDLYAIRLGLQLTKNDLVDLKIINVQTSSGLELHDSDDDDIKQSAHRVDSAMGDSQSPGAHVAAEYAAIRSTHAHSDPSRISFTDHVVTGQSGTSSKATSNQSSSIEPLVHAMSEPSGAETIVIVGRNPAPSSSGGILNVSSASESRALGSSGTQIVKTIRDKGIQAAVLVVQGKKEKSPAEVEAEKTRPGTSEEGVIA
ncbi:hypothetical protein B0A52_03963 [Exophiala mesophila]|uniref:Cation/H+ exchanger transmembrane domain-containing protein n=1 Tax=Exophiala mesophila TaxID=212818 RepID=A0A438N9W3_EXOME|nr:hypothetical protein B0A52_03963 [Exophiala mesophila]